MNGSFRLEQVGKEEDGYASNGEATLGFGPFAPTGDRVQYHFREEEMTLEEAEAYIGSGLNQLPAEAIDDLCGKLCTWKDEIVNEIYPEMRRAEGIAEAKGRAILPFLSISDIYLYRNPYNRQDPVLGAALYAGMDWDYEDGIEIVIRGSEILETREFLGYGEFAIWEEEEETSS
ncbi:hypothetical protein [Gorillibacterium sp. CAU 1737]|uniref:hypothetical protein n=1 Tax=Gorillibacterium sp. CAU 1737 TaxID=3140362 RepID=UPI003260BF36